MFSFLILCLLYGVPCIYYFVTDLIKFNKISYKMIFALALLVIAVLLKSMNL